MLPTSRMGVHEVSELQAVIKDGHGGNVDAPMQDVNVSPPNPVSRRTNTQKRRHRLSTIRSEDGAILNGTNVAHSVQRSPPNQAEASPNGSSSRRAYGFPISPVVHTSEPQKISDDCAPSTLSLSSSSLSILSQREGRQSHASKRPANTMPESIRLTNDAKDTPLIPPIASHASTVSSSKISNPFRHRAQDFIARPSLREAIPENSHGSAVPIPSKTQSQSRDESSDTVNMAHIVSSSDALPSLTYMASSIPGSCPVDEGLSTCTRGVAAQAHSLASKVLSLESGGSPKDDIFGTLKQPGPQPPGGAQREQREWSYGRIAPTVEREEGSYITPQDNDTRSNSLARTSIPSFQPPIFRPQSPNHASMPLDRAPDLYSAARMTGSEEIQGNRTMQYFREQGGRFEGAKEDLSKIDVLSGAGTAYQELTSRPDFPSAPPDTLLGSRFAHNTRTFTLLQPSYSDVNPDIKGRSDAAKQSTTSAFAHHESSLEHDQALTLAEEGFVGVYQSPSSTSGSDGGPFEQRTPDFGHGSEVWDSLFPFDKPDVHEDNSQRQTVLPELKGEETTTIEREVQDSPKTARRPEVESKEGLDEPLESLSPPLSSSSGDYDHPISPGSRSYPHDSTVSTPARGSTITRVITSSPDPYVERVSNSSSTGSSGITQESSNVSSRTSPPPSFPTPPPPLVVDVNRNYDHALDSAATFPRQNMQTTSHDRQTECPGCLEDERGGQAHELERLAKKPRSIEQATEGNAPRGFAPIIHDFALNPSPMRNRKEHVHRGSPGEQDPQHPDRVRISCSSDTSPHQIIPPNVHADESTQESFAHDDLSPPQSAVPDSDYDRDGYTPLLSDDSGSESSNRPISFWNDLPTDDMQHAPKRALAHQATSFTSDDRWLKLTFEYKTMRDNARYHQVIQECLRSETVFDGCLSYCKNDEHGKEFADAILCTMQQMLHDRYGLTVEFGNDSLHSFRRTMMKLAVNSQVMPSTLFLRGIQCSETEPRFGGGYADVFHGSAASGQAVALKRLRIFQGSSEEKNSIALCREALVWVQLRHPNVLPFLGLDNKTFRAFCMVSPWMNNGNLSSYLRDHNQDATPRLKYQWICEVAHGLRYLHGEQVVHGDLRGANILLDDDRRVCLADFGLARFTDAQQITMGGNSWHSGALRWMPPEVLSGAKIDYAGDVYSFGCVCLEIVTAQHPFPNSPYDAQVIDRVSKGESPSWPATKHPMLEGLDKVVGPCWHREPSKRPKIAAVDKILSSA